MRSSRSSRSEAHKSSASLSKCSADSSRCAEVPRTFSSPPPAQAPAPRRALSNGQVRSRIDAVRAADGARDHAILCAGALSNCRPAHERPADPTILRSFLPSPQIMPRKQAASSGGGASSSSASAEADGDTTMGAVDDLVGLSAEEFRRMQAMMCEAEARRMASSGAPSRRREPAARTLASLRR
jgi:hypothetical protein